MLSAIDKPEAFAGLRERFAQDPDVVNRTAQGAAARPSTEILEAWRLFRTRVLATRRRHRQDCDLTIEGPGTDAWLDIVQTYAGLPSPGRSARSGLG